MADLVSTTCTPFSDMGGKGPDEVSPILFSDVFEEGVHVSFVAEVLPMCPISQAYFGSLSHDPAGTLLLCSSIQTREVSLVCGRSISHDASCESGKSELNLVRNSESERL